MHCNIEAKACAATLREELGKLGHQLKHSQCLEAISKLEGYPDWNSHTADIQAKQLRAEEFLDEMIKAEEELSYAKFTQRFEQKYLVKFTEHQFFKDMRDISEDQGGYIKREFIGSISGKQHDADERYPNLVRYLWRGVFEKCEVLISLGIYRINGTYYINEFRYR